MSTQVTAIQLPPDPHPKLSRFRAKLSREGLLGVLDSLPTAAAFQYHESTFHKNPAIKIRLGQRRQMNEELATSWAFIELENSDVNPPVRFTDEVHQPPEHSRNTRSSACALLQEAGDLLPPFRFMQLYDYDKVKNVRGMLCALVLYYALIRGVSDAALEWNQFQNSLMQALQYIETQPAYHLWLNEAVTEPASSQETLTAPPSAASPSKARSPDLGPRSILRGGSVSSRGSSMTPPAGSRLAIFMDVLGKDLPLLDHLPSTPVTIEPQTVDPEQFSFRLLFGKCKGVDVHVYPNLAGSRVTKIMSRSQYQEQSWSYSNLKGVEVLKPFAWLQKLLPNSVYRDSKMRFLVAYYFWLAEAEGLIDSPTFNFAPESMRAPFVALCKMFQRAAISHDNLHNHADVPKRDSKPSLIVRLRPAAEVLSILNEDTDDTIGTQAQLASDAQVTDHQTRDDTYEPLEEFDDDGMRNPTPSIDTSLQPNHEKRISGSSAPHILDTDLMSRVTDDPLYIIDGHNVHSNLPVTSPDLETTETPQSARALSGDSGSNSKYATPASTVVGTNIIRHNSPGEKHVEDESEDVMGTSAEVFPAHEPASDEPDLGDDEGLVSSIEEPEEPQSSPQEAEASLTKTEIVQDQPTRVVNGGSSIKQLASDAMDIDDVLATPIEEADKPQPPIQETSSSAEEQPLATDLPTRVPSDENHAEATVPEAMEPNYEPTPVFDGSGTASPPPEMGLDLIEDTPEREPGNQRQRSVFGISSDDEIQANGTNYPVPRLTLQDESPWRETRFRNSGDFIDFTKDDNESTNVVSGIRRQDVTGRTASSRSHLVPRGTMQWPQPINISHDDNEDDNDNMGLRPASR